MPTYLTPGVYIEELSASEMSPFPLTYRAEPEEQAEITAPRWIAEHSTAAFVGLAVRGPAHMPTLVHSWPEYEQRFGGRLTGTYLGEAVLGFFANGGRSCYVVRINDLAVDAVGLDDLVGDSDDRSGLAGLELVEDISAVAVPDVMSLYERDALDMDGVKAAQLATIAHCEIAGDRLAILDSPPGLSPDQVRNWRMDGAGFDSKYSALYYPWLKVAGQEHYATPVPPCGYVAGVFARTDLHQHAANELILGTLGTQTEVTLQEQELLNPIGINALVDAAGRGLRVWGARTLSSDPSWRFVRKRRLMNFITRAVRHAAGWVIFEDAQDRRVHARLKRTLDDFLAVLWRSGILGGEDPGESYYVICDAETNPPEAVDRGLITADCAASLHDGSDLHFRVVCYLG
ncbi:phage tail sheath subtilisin-like domain-containing protein [Amycolatopsis sp. NPDC051102]|uniref:phage tail sheath family protein n=1 Tax=Amycolatopsis sp. NPDC051102 TaxID=3155163 RepID=UPI003433DCA5